MYLTVNVGIQHAILKVLDIGLMNVDLSVK